MKKLLFILLLTIPFIGFGQSIGYSSNYDGSLYKTTDSGITWSLQGSTSTGTFTNLNFVNSTTGYQNDYSTGNVYKTTNSGVTWTLQGGITGSYWNKISFVNSTTGYMFGVDSVIGTNIYKTTDSGVTWTLQNNFPYSESSFNVSFVDSITGYYSRYNGDIYKTTNSGNTWTLQSSLTDSVWEISFVNDTTGYYSTDWGIYGIYKTTDSGITWSLQNMSFSGVNLDFVNSTTGYSSGNGGYIYKTTDSGTTWTLQGGLFWENRISFVSDMSTSTFNIPIPSSNRKLEKVVDILGRETKPQTNTPFIKIYNDGSTEKKIVVE